MEDRQLAFVGAGASMVAPTSLPSWLSVNRGVLSSLVSCAAPLLGDAQKLGDAVVARQEAWLLPSEYFAEVIVGTIGGDYFPVLQSLDSETPNDVHRMLAFLAGRGELGEIITTNFDRAIEAAFREAGVPLEVRFR